MLKGLTMGERMTLQGVQEKIDRGLDTFSPDIQKKITVGDLTPLVWEVLIEHLKRKGLYGYRCPYDEYSILINKIR